MKVAVVGSSACLLGSGLGLAIDACDKVVRCNCFNLARRYAPDVGTRITHWSLTMADCYKAFLRFYKRRNVRPRWIRTIEAVWTTEPDRPWYWSHVNVWRRWRPDVEKIIEPPDSLTPFLACLLNGSIASSGCVAAIKAMLRFPGAEVWLAGFGGPEQIDEPERHVSVHYCRPDRAARIGHDLAAEYRALLRIGEQTGRLRFW